MGGAIAKLLSFDFHATRRSHMDHHRRTGFPDDPDRHEYVFERTYRSVPAFLFQETLLGPTRGALRRLSGSEKGNAMQPTVEGRRRHLLLLALAQGALLVLFGLTGHWWGYFAFWLLPLMTIAGPLTRLRTFCEHAGMNPERPSRHDQIFYTRSTLEERGGLPGLYARLERFVIAPFHFNYHHEHHLLPQVPYRYLPEVHRMLRESGHYGRHPELLSPSYQRTVWSQIRPDDQVPEHQPARTH